MSPDSEVAASAQLGKTTDEGGLRRVWAEIRGDGHLVVQGQDLGPGTAPISADGEYEYAYSIKVEDIAVVLAALGAEAGADPLAYLTEHWSGPAAFALTRRLHGMAEAEFWSYSG